MTGRCAGCEKTGPGPRMRVHVTECPDWLALPPERQLEPEAEHVRWLEKDRAAERDERRARAIADSTALRAGAVSRFAVSRDLDRLLDAEAG